MIDVRNYVKKLSGEDVNLCTYCGECASSCPIASHMDALPPTIIRYIQMGDTSVLKLNSIWLCIGCYTCTTRCPRGLDVASIIGAVRQIVLREEIKTLRYVGLKEGKYEYINLAERRFLLPREELKDLPQVALVRHFVQNTLSREL